MKETERLIFLSGSYFEKFDCHISNKNICVLTTVQCGGGTKVMWEDGTSSSLSRLTIRVRLYWLHLRLLGCKRHFNGHVFRSVQFFINIRTQHMYLTVQWNIQVWKPEKNLAKKFLLKITTKKPILEKSA